MALGVQASWALGVANLKTNFNWNNKDVRSRYVVRYTQAYYTVDLDAPARPSDFFDPGVTLDDVKERVGADNPPLYVGSITYGPGAYAGRQAFGVTWTGVGYYSVRTDKVNDFQLILANRSDTACQFTTFHHAAM